VHLYLALVKRFLHHCLVSKFVILFQCNIELHKSGSLGHIRVFVSSANALLLYIYWLKTSNSYCNISANIAEMIRSLLTFLTKEMEMEEYHSRLFVRSCRIWLLLGCSSQST